MGGYRGCINSIPPTLHLLLFCSGGKEGLHDTSSHEEPLAESPLWARHQARRLNVICPSQTERTRYPREHDIPLRLDSSSSPEQSEHAILYWRPTRRHSGLY